ncbi:hypothetical protein RRG08_003258 [Elysia crispata]|uniref:Uncharacterized protein n=1 Tax=Elysia crispata TaxID=231223 RepID=A0AAE1DAR8_9GAST|nr:hypothetical protein RRG08_003258 [Elysia crispata]
MVLVTQKSAAETPSAWQDVFQAAGAKPEPSNVNNRTQEKFLAFSDFLRPRYLAMCPITTRLDRELYVSKEHLQFLMHREDWNGSFSSIFRETHLIKRCLGF